MVRSNENLLLEPSVWMELSLVEYFRREITDPRRKSPSFWQKNPAAGQNGFVPRKDVLQSRVRRALGRVPC